MGAAAYSPELLAAVAAAEAAQVSNISTLVAQRGGRTHLIKTITFAGATGNGGLGGSGQITVVTPTGLVYIYKIIPVITVAVTATATGTLSLGTTETVAGLIAATASDTAMGTVGNYWVNTAPDTDLIAIPTALLNFITGDAITMTAATAATLTGAITFDIEWEGINGGLLI